MDKKLRAKLRKNFDDGGIRPFRGIGKMPGAGGQSKSESHAAAGKDKSQTEPQPK